MEITQAGLYRVRNGNVAMVSIILTGNPDVGLPVIGKMFHPVDGIVHEVDMAWDEYGEGTDESLDLIKFIPIFVSDPPKTSRNRYLRRSKIGLNTRSHSDVNVQIWENAKKKKELNKQPFVPV